MMVWKQRWQKSDFLEGRRVFFEPRGANEDVLERLEAAKAKGEKRGVPVEGALEGVDVHLEGDRETAAAVENSKEGTNSPRREDDVADVIQNKFESNKLKFDSNVTDEFLKLYHGTGILSGAKIGHNFSELVHGRLGASVSSNADANRWLDRQSDKAQWWGKKAVALAGSARDNIGKYARIEHERWSTKFDTLEGIVQELEFRQDHELGLMRQMEIGMKNRWMKYANPLAYRDSLVSFTRGVGEKVDHLRGTEANKEQVTAIATVNAALAVAKNLLEKAENKKVKWQERIDNANQKESRDSRDREAEGLIDTFFWNGKTPAADEKKNLDQQVGDMWRQREDTKHGEHRNKHEEKAWRRAVVYNNFDKMLLSEKQRLKILEDRNLISESPQSKRSLDNQSEYVSAMERSLHARVNTLIQKNQAIGVIESG